MLTYTIFRFCNPTDGSVGIKHLMYTPQWEQSKPVKDKLNECPVRLKDVSYYTFNNLLNRSATTM